jgi:3'(2'), 5'-bisphosphate nucleotidase
LVSRSHRPALVEPLRRRLGLSALVPCGSAGVKGARVARGEAELYVHDGPGMKLWDVCAADALVCAAGGRLTDLLGRAIDYRGPDLELCHGVCATNGVLHAGVLSAVEWARREVERIGG